MSAVEKEQQIMADEEQQQQKRTWHYFEERTDLEAVEGQWAIDLREEALKAYRLGIPFEIFTLVVDGEAESADVLYFPTEGRMGIAWGADASWADVNDAESGMEMYVNDEESWEVAN